MLDKMLGQGNDFGVQLAEVGRVLDHAYFIGPSTRHQAGPGGTANSLLTIGPIEAHAFLGKLIQVRGLGDRGTITTQLGSQVIDCDEKNVRTFIGEDRHRRDQKDRDEEIFENGFRTGTHSVWQSEQAIASNNESALLSRSSSSKGDRSLAKTYKVARNEELSS
jgi:hypothetical protein